MCDSTDQIKDNTPLPHYNLVILVIASRNRLYDAFIYFMWKPIIEMVKKHFPNVLIKLLYNNTPTDDLKMDEDIWKFGFSESITPGILLKTVSAFEQCNQVCTYDFLLRTNLSSFIRIDELIKKLQTYPKTRVYDGISAKYDTFYYCNGSGITFSSDVVNYIISNKFKLNLAIVDDASIGLLLSTYVHPFEHHTRYDLTKYFYFREISTSAINYIFNNIYNNHIIQIRIKNKNRNIDPTFASILTKHFVIDKYELS